MPCVAVVIAGTSSGVGKTTVATGLMAALRRRGAPVASAKVGPDFIDPGYHALATGRPGRNLDAWICGPDLMAPLARRAAAGLPLVVEGVMGLFDGPSSTAEVALLLQAPVVLVVDAAAMSGSVAALVHGFTSFDPRLDVAGVVLNRVGSDGHEVLLREALAPLGVPVLGVLRRDPAFAWRDRHLGLVPVVEQAAEVRRSLDRLADAVAAGCDLDAFERLASSPIASGGELPAPRHMGAARIAVAGGPAFSFVYADNVEALEAAGAEVVPFDPLADEALPDGIGGLYVGGGFPEVFVEALAANRPLLADVRARLDEGLATWAECGGLLWLARSLDKRPLVGHIPTDGEMTDRLTLGYRTASVAVDNPVAAAGSVLKGHEFHYSTVTPPGDALHLEGRLGRGPGGFATPTLLASYLHLHLAGAPQVAERFVESSCRRMGSRWKSGAVPPL